MSLVEGFGGYRVVDDVPHFQPMLPSAWEGYTFNLNFRGRRLQIAVTSNGCQATLKSGDPLDIVVSGQKQRLG